MSSYAYMTGCSFHVRPEHVEKVTKGLVQTRFDPQINDGGIFDLGYYGELDTEDTFDVLRTVAPFVEDGSYIEMSGDSICRYVFQGGECHEVFPEILWLRPGSGKRRVIIIVEGGMVTGVITNDLSIDLVDVLDRDNRAQAEGVELSDLEALEKEIEAGVAVGILHTIY